MSSREKREIRQSQLISTYGVGSIVALGDQSFMVAGIDRWDTDANLYEPRLERELRVDGFAFPPATDDGKDIPVVRFPRWQSCPVCKKLALHRDFASLHGNECNACGVILTPSRFVMACEAGHIDDFPYFLWVHKGKPPTGDRHGLSIEAGGQTAGLGDVQIQCECGHTRTMEGAFDRNALRGITGCRGRRPWLQKDDDDCTELPRTLQRGASNVWFSVTRSALSIPPWSKGAFRILNKHWPVFKALDPAALPGLIESMGLAENTPYSVHDLVASVKLRQMQETDPDAIPDTTIREQEYEALTKGASGAQSKLDQFVCEPGTLGERAHKWLERVMLVRRLREVRVLQSFTRVQPPGPADDASRRPPLFDEHPGWLPAIEVIGEGVFLGVDPERLRSWETNGHVVARAEGIDSNYRQLFTSKGISPDRKITPRFLMLHAFAHAIINQWSLDSGYPAASLRERLYAGDDQAGILIYTATTDSAGSLGGVVGLAEPDRLDDAIGEAIARASWCSMDPVCIESDVGGVDALNRAACHACSLLPEVSCEEQNVLLDRGMLVGAGSTPGFFSDLVATV
jgi:hypothetical protein